MTNALTDTLPATDHTNELTEELELQALIDHDDDPMLWYFPEPDTSDVAPLTDPAPAELDWLPF